MKKLILICLLYIPTFICAQKPKVDNIELDVQDTEVIINYELIDIQESPKNIDLILIDKSKNVYIPENIEGNIGTNLNTGKNKLSFNMSNQSFPLDRELTPTVILNRNIKQGPNAALYSLLVPGLGDYFVENPKNMIIKPYYRTIAVGGLLALAIIANQNIEKPVSYNEEVWIPGWTSSWSGRHYPGYYETQTFKTSPKDYWLFNNDVAIFTGAAVSIWLFDIFWVLTKGQQNQKIKSALKNKTYDFALSGNGFSLQVNLD